MTSLPRTIGIAAVALLLVAAVALLSRGDAPRAQATGTGPAIALGTVSGTTVPVNATTTATDAYKGFNIHIGLLSSAGITTLTATGAAGAVLPGTTFCPAASNTGNPVATDSEFACTIVSGAPAGTTASGILANFVLSAQGNGCIVVSLVTAPPPGNAILNTYTVNNADNSQQSNSVDTTTTAKVLIGTGILSDCPTPPTPTATSTATPTFTATSTFTATNTPTATNTATNTPTATATATATATSTPCANGTPCPTATTTATAVASTHTPTPTNSAVPTATNTTAAGASTTRPAAAATQPGGGAGAGGTAPKSLPNTGADTNRAFGGNSQYVWLAMALATAAALGGGMLLTVRRKR